MEVRVTADGFLHWPGGCLRCALGRGGIGENKVEGDGVTPVGHFPLRRVFYRPDREAEPKTALSAFPLSDRDGWCDDPGHPDYNRHVGLPFPASHEEMWRDDALYDLVVEIGYNDDPPVSGRGSAIFLHVAADGYSPTEGCVALAKSDLRDLLASCDAATTITITTETA